MFRRKIGVGLAINLGLVVGSASMPRTAGGQVFVSNFLSNSVAEYDLSGNVLKNPLISGAGGWGISVEGSDIFVVSGNTIGEYTTSGATVNASLITGLSTPRGVAVVGSSLYVANQGNGTIGEYTISNGTVTASDPTFITGLTTPTGIAISGSDLFEANLVSGTVGEYTTSGQPVDPTLVAGLSVPDFLTVVGPDLYIAQYFADTVAQADIATGAVLNPSLITGLSGPEEIVNDGSTLFIANSGSDSIGEYDTAGDTLVPQLVAGLSDPNGVAVAVPEPASVCLLGLIGMAGLLHRRRVVG